MKLIILVACAFLAVAAAAPPVKEVSLIRSSFEQDPEGSYVSEFETDDGTRREETGEIKEVLNEENKPQKVVIVRGSYGFTDPDGKVQTITYTADENGFHPEGEGIPQAPVARR